MNVALSPGFISIIMYIQALIIRFVALKRYDLMGAVL